MSSDKISVCMFSLMKLAVFSSGKTGCRCFWVYKWMHKVCASNHLANFSDSCRRLGSVMWCYGQGTCGSSSRKPVGLEPLLALTCPLERSSQHQTPSARVGTTERLKIKAWNSQEFLCSQCITSYRFMYYHYQDFWCCYKHLYLG